MSKAAMDWATRQTIEDGVMKPVLTALAYRLMEGKDLFLSQATLADMTGNTDRTVREALRLLQHFGVLGRKSRSNGAGGRSSDAFTLTLDREFTLTRKVISTARKALSKRKQLPPANLISQPEPASGGPGASFRGIDTLGDTLPVRDHRVRGKALGPEAGNRLGLRLVVGGSD